MIRNLFRNDSPGEPTSPDQLTGGLTTNRLEAFSDGVFAIAITILVLSIEAPRLAEVNSAQDLLDKVLELLPKLFTYVLSFVVVGTYWVAHSATFHYIKRTNRPLFWLNLVYLLCVSFIPFPTALLGTFYQYQLAVVIYAATQALTGLLFQTMVWYATRAGLSRANLDRGFLRRAAFRNLTGPVIYGVAILISFVSVPISLILLALVPILYILPGRLDRDWRRIPASEGTYPQEAVTEAMAAARQSQVRPCWPTLVKVSSKRRSDRMQVTIIGTGNVGGNLGRALSAKGHQIVYGVRDPQSQKTQATLSALGEAASVKSIAEAVAASQVIFLTVPGNVVADTLANAGDLSGKTLVDCTNRTDKLPSPGQSSLEATASAAPGAHVVKCFNTMSAETYLKPKFGNSTATAFYCGDDAGAKNTLKQLGEDMGFEMHDLGGQSNGYLMDAIFQAWVALAFGQKLGRRLGFRVLTAQDDL